MTVATKVRFNRGINFTSVSIKNFQTPSLNYKYASLKHVLGLESTNDTVLQIVAQCPLQHQHKRILIDVKVQHLVSMVTSCIPGWHLDGPGNPLHPSKPEVHHLYIHQEGGETEFIADEFDLPVDKQMSHSDIVQMIPKDVSIFKTKSRHFATFTRFDFHRGITVKEPMTRLLVRLTETDAILPNNKPYFHSVGSQNMVDISTESV